MESYEELWKEGESVNKKPSLGFGNIVCFRKEQWTTSENILSIIHMLYIYRDNIFYIHSLEACFENSFHFQITMDSR